MITEWKIDVVCVWNELNFSAYLHFQFIFYIIYGFTTLFDTIHESHYIIQLIF